MSVAVTLTWIGRKARSSISAGPGRPSGGRADAERRGETYEKLRAQVMKHAGLEALKSQLLREKSLDLITSVANIQSEE